MRSLILVIFLSSTLVVGSSRYLDAKTQEPQPVAPSKDQIVEGVGQDWNVVSFELPPGTIHAWQSQPGGEFIYVLEGAGRLEVEGKPAITLNPGAASTLTSIPHHVLKNTSRTKPLKVLVVFFNDNSEPHPLVPSAFAQGPRERRDGSLDGKGKATVGPQQRSGDIGLVF
ncbi:MAG TPA: cupin domain-containing protein [Nitrospira sp.]|nr:cupin domain-containing protein [Nitrospira sp.]